MKKSRETATAVSECRKHFQKTGGYFAGKLIMDAGLRGYQVGGAQVSEKHCGFVINKGCNSSRYLSADEGRIG